MFDESNGINKVLEWFSDAGVRDVSIDINAVRQNSDGENVNTLLELKEVMKRVNTPLKECALNMVFGVGNEHADVLLLGEAPGAEEDKQGVPFVGQSGQLLDKILASVGLDRAKVYIMNILPWRPPGNRTPTSQEVTLFRPYVIKHISLVNPKIVVCLGGVASKALLQTTLAMSHLRGKWARVKEFAAEIMPTFHPAYLLRSPSQKREAWLDFLSVKNKIRELG